LNITSRAKSKRQVEANGRKTDMKLLLHLEVIGADVRPDWSQTGKQAGWGSAHR
jgi:hypothetical protein